MADLMKRAISRMGRLVDRVVRRAGYQVIPSWRVAAFEQSRQLRHLFTQLEIDTVLDIGANVGGYRTLLRTHVGYTGQIISFEPVAAAFEALEQAAGRDRAWRGYRMALGDEDGELMINVTQRSTMSSFLQRDEPALRGLGYEHLLNVTNVLTQERVTVRRLDTLLREVVPDPTGARLYLKCDTQGFDLKVIEGAADSLRYVRAMQVELSIHPIYAGAPVYGEVLQRLSSAGFDIAGMYPVRRDEISRVLNFDAVLVNSRHPAVVALAAGIVKGRQPLGGLTR